MIASDCKSGQAADSNTGLVPGSCPPALRGPTRQEAACAFEAPFGSARSFGAGRLSIDYVQTFFGVERMEALMSDAGLCRPDGGLPDSISRVDFWNLCVDGIFKYNDEGHGCTPQPLPKGSFTMIFTAINHMDTVGEGLKRFSEFIQVIPSGMTVTVGHGSDGVHLSYAMRDASPRGETYVELIALVFHCVLLWGTARSIDPVHIRLSAALQDHHGSLLADLAKGIWRHGSGVSIVYPREILDFKLGVRRYKSFSFHETTTFMELADRPLLDENSASDTLIINTVRQLMQDGVPSQSAAAERLNMSLATLQRRLSRAGTSFRELSKEVRVRKLCSLLATDANLDDIAVDLGFSDRRSLWRACFNWLGMSPTTYRAQRRTVAGPSH
ncbi:helix-turn-helix domain-containing protein [Niveispirillum sp.]|uniref:AraC family transcriptional regulator n=1 Tax=Niveispirillum sp. TaxID=1917217 RepID=UPI001B59AC5A|nr:helix-turn-helix domain-containing protein [Niveispirillum sp.]MBP7335289.1 helix-turn-helix domain-containing protein [Niveispirillum sp.]